MTVRQTEDLLSKIRSSYLWTNDEVPSNFNDQTQQITNFVHRIESKSDWDGPIKESIPAHLELTSSGSNILKPNPPWSPEFPQQFNSSESLIKSKKTSKCSDKIFQVRLSTIGLVSCVLILCALAIGIPLAFILNSSEITTQSASTASPTSATTTTAPATGWLPSNYYTPCATTCISVSTVTPSTLLASWPFENNANDVSGNANHGQIMNGAIFTTGYIGQAIQLLNDSAQYVAASYMDFTNRSFTVEAWVYPYLLQDTDAPIFTECEVKTIDKCLHYLLREQNIYLAFYNDDIRGTTQLTSYTWYHVAFVYDYANNIKTAYLNGIIDATSSASAATASKSAYLGTNGEIRIGAWEYYSYAWDGLIDQVIVSNRVKTYCEILNDATLVAHFAFDGTYNDIGPNSMKETHTSQSNSGVALVTGRVNQAINFNLSNSYSQSCGYYSLGQNQPYSIAMWVNPSFPGGTLFHLSSDATGSGAWCLPMIGFNSNGSIVGQTWNGSRAISLVGPILPINNWTHVVLTYSSTNGLQLYINGGLYSSAPIDRFAASNRIMCVTLANSLLGTNCQTGSISMGAFQGAIDEFYVYNRELNDAEVCPLAHP